MVAAVSTAIQSILQSTLSFQVSLCSICDCPLYCHKADFLTTHKIWSKLRFIFWLHILLTSSKFCNVDTTFDWRTIRRLSQPSSVTHWLMFSHYVNYVKWYALVIPKRWIHHNPCVTWSFVSFRQVSDGHQIATGPSCYPIMTHVGQWSQG